jgi:hypothetical protein
VVTAHSADIIASLIALKKEIEDVTSTTLKLTIAGASEAHLLAAELAAANVGVLLNPPRQHPYMWEYKRILPGPPLSEESTAATLKRHGVTVAIGPQGTLNFDALSGWAVRNLRFDAGWVSSLDCFHLVFFLFTQLCFFLHSSPWNPADPSLTQTH